MVGSSGQKIGGAEFGVFDRRPLQGVNSTTAARVPLEEPKRHMQINGVKVGNGQQSKKNQLQFFYAS